MSESRPAECDAAIRPESGWSFPGLKFSPPNPFYLLSAAAFLHATGIWAGQQGRSLPDQVRLILIGSYLVAMALTALLIVRAWKQWADARSVVLIVLLLFAELALSFDDAVLRDRAHGARLLCAALGVAVVVSELLIRGLRLNFPARYRLPYYAQMGLLFLFPLVLAGPAGASDWNLLRLELYGFSWLAAGSLLLLIPAVGQGARGIEDTGTPWKWPMYPWPAFVFLGLCLLARTFAQCLSFDSASSVSTRVAIESLPSVFGPHFLAPFVLAVGILLYIAADRCGDLFWRSRVLVLFAAAALLLSFNPRIVNPMTRDLLASLSSLFVAPPQMMLIVLMTLFAIAALRGDRTARSGLLVAAVIQSCVDRGTVDWGSFCRPRPEILGIIGLGLVIHGLAARRSVAFVAGGVGVIAASRFGGFLSNPLTSESVVTVHALIAVLLLAGLAFDDRLAAAWRWGAAGLLATAEMAISVIHHSAPDVSLLYVAIIGAMGVAIARARRDFVFALLAAGSVLLIEANAAWLGMTVLQSRFAWQGAPLLLSAWFLLLGGLHLSAWKGGAATPVRKWLLGESVAA
ncbi:hypothetical protein Pan44_19980 [Caulifigura coniformis]|uniref:Uncharacterized protein n=1 Tax=Caulifigura coniformis TaxID=2527983 RepID=A0A517SCX5_9PLAN|nr:hypothetical protein [Caulifigura coniformis]QDT53971.1 hypothetical protein Pan44_19980 [Caulifigura coniformis]